MFAKPKDAFGCLLEAIEDVPIKDFFELANLLLQKNPGT